MTTFTPRFRDATINGFLANQQAAQQNLQTQQFAGIPSWYQNAMTGFGQFAPDPASLQAAYNGQTTLQPGAGMGTVQGIQQGQVASSMRYGGQLGLGQQQAHQLASPTQPWLGQNNMQYGLDSFLSNRAQTPAYTNSSPASRKPRRAFPKSTFGGY